MENPFYSALKFNGMGIGAKEAAENTKEVLMPFIHYLNNSIDALKNKEVSCNWQPVSNRRFRLNYHERIYKLVPESKIEVRRSEAGWFEILSEADADYTPLDDDFDIDISDPITVGKGKTRQQYQLTEQDVAFENGSHKIYLPDLRDETVISWVGYQLRVRPVCVSLADIKSIHIDSQKCDVISVSENRIHFKGSVTANSRLSINGQDFPFDLLTTLNKQALDKYRFREQGNYYLLFAREKPRIDSQKVEDVTEEHLSTLTVSHFVINGVELEAKSWALDQNKGELVLDMLQQAKLKNGCQIECSQLPEIVFSLENSKQEEKWIQLIENENAEDSGKSELDYFFEDRVSILDQNQRRNDRGYRVLKSRPEERQLLLASDQKGANKWKSVYPTQAGQNKKNELRVSVDISQLIKQKDALNRLMNRPDKDHQALIHLLQPRMQTRWQDFEPDNELDWQVLTDSTFDGCDRQREFVCKALATPDFAILDGPPGTGKTTTILELIIQLISSGKRILLSASTHAAINNVLERIVESQKLQKSIFPLRIGDESNAIGVEQFQFDNQLKALRDSLGEDIGTKQLLVDSSNLVCGTTIGILRLFNEKELHLDTASPPFDVMIIDECSKTTFQEFLVPARFAKRWILVGDERQLSPFTDREQIVANLDNLMLKPKRGKEAAQTLSPDVQQACFLLEELSGTGKPHEIYQQPMLVPVSSSVLDALNGEIQSRLKLANKLGKGLEHIYLVTKDKNQLTRQSRHSFTSGDGATISNVAVIKQEPWRFYTHRLYFVDQNVLKQLDGIIPDDILIVHPEWQSSEHAFVHRAAKQQHVNAFQVKTTDYNKTDEISEELLERISSTKWSEEVCWRLEREYWLRLSADHRRKTGYLSQTIERLIPKSVKADGRVHILRNIAFPSVLEALSGSGLEKRRTDIPTTLNQGFDTHERESRYTTLTYQHRMHPDISAFPRQQFYPKGVLEDGGKTVQARSWQYSRYSKRNTWLDVRQGAIFRNSNVAEVETVIQELKVFCDWAEKNPKRSADGKPEFYNVAILTFYKGQEKALREKMQKSLPGNPNRYARFNYKGVEIKLATVDYFQGQEADLVFLSMVNNRRDGFMDSPNRLNVAITRARYQMVIVGDHKYFAEKSRTAELSKLARSSSTVTVKGLKNYSARSRQ